MVKLSKGDLYSGKKVEKVSQMVAGGLCLVCADLWKFSEGMMKDFLPHQFKNFSGVVTFTTTLKSRVLPQVK